MLPKRFVYVLRSDSDPSRHYVGISSNVQARLDWHNGLVMSHQVPQRAGHTQQYRPWSVVVTVEFRTEAAAVRFEKYLKSNSGRAFAKRHFDVA